MTGDEFEKEMTRLTDRFKKSHPNAYPPEVQKIFWGYLKTLSANDWAQTVNKLMAFNTFPPMLDKVQVFVNPILDKIYQREKTTRRFAAQRAMENLKENDISNHVIGDFVRKLQGVSDDK